MTLPRCQPYYLIVWRHRYLPGVADSRFTPFDFGELHAAAKCILRLNEINDNLIFSIETIRTLRWDGDPRKSFLYGLGAFIFKSIITILTTIFFFLLIESIYIKTFSGSSIYVGMLFNTSNWNSSVFNFEMFRAFLFGLLGGGFGIWFGANISTPLLSGLYQLINHIFHIDIMEVQSNDR